MSDFIIVGRGLAAMALAHTFHRHGITFKIIGKTQLSASSLVAAGIFNPLVFKRMTMSWLADETIPFLKMFYPGCEKKLGAKFLTERTFIKPFVQEQEKLLWEKKRKTELNNFLDENVYEKDEKLRCFIIENGYGKVLQAGNVDLPLFLRHSEIFFKDAISDAYFDYSELRVSENSVSYKGHSASSIVFCEGHLVKDNPWFGWLPLKPVKGELVSLRCEELNIKDAVFNKDGFIMDEGNGLYKAGATYYWDDLSEAPTERGRREMTERIRKMISCAFEITGHKAGIRPSTADRRPIIGEHPRYPRLFIFNGLGTKGVMLAPYFADKFVNFWRKNTVLNPQVNLQRFYHLYPNDN